MEAEAPQLGRSGHRRAIGERREFARWVALALFPRARPVSPQVRPPPEPEAVREAQIAPPAAVPYAAQPGWPLPVVPLVGLPAELPGVRQESLQPGLAVVAAHLLALCDLGW